LARASSEYYGNEFGAAEQEQVFADLEQAVELDPISTERFTALMLEKKGPDELVTFEATRP
jgi:hypothetical protein